MRERVPETTGRRRVADIGCRSFDCGSTSSNCAASFTLTNSHFYTRLGDKTTRWRPGRGSPSTRRRRHRTLEASPRGAARLDGAATPARGGLALLRQIRCIFINHLVNFTLGSDPLFVSYIKYSKNPRWRRPSWISNYVDSL